MKTITISASIFLLFSALIFSCKKSPGVGGTSTIKGRIVVKNYTVGWPGPSTYLGTNYGQEVSVYLIYGDTGFYSDNIKTSFDGRFEFPFLNKGKYKIFTYSADTTLSGKSPVEVSVTIDKNKSTVDVGEITIVKTH